MRLYNPNVFLIKNRKRERQGDLVQVIVSRDERGKQNRLRGELFSSQEPQPGRAIDSGHQDAQGTPWEPELAQHVPH